ncbi:hypothetical protein ANN_24335 [Periplaneta americana]|uniref:Uncharacterized protein n=1 Tax=Periplaneta americana TaxID=6978 RepID=A0ABQ8S381_PERAM|nr:hypothetical protein ANN_24335 [Periplaneta americana]
MEQSADECESWRYIAKLGELTLHTLALTLARFDSARLPRESSTRPAEGRAQKGELWWALRHRTREARALADAEARHGKESYGPGTDKHESESELELNDDGENDEQNMTDDLRVRQ